MKNLLIPMAGKSTRFPNLKPKWMLTHPITNRFMAVESILGLNLDFFDKIYFICLEEHEKKYKFLTGFLNEINELNLENKTEVIFLKEQTKSQSETIYNFLIENSVNGFIFIKDSDNYYECEINNTNNQIAFFDLNDLDDINARNKSYLEFDLNGLIVNIVEKKVISSTFSVGGYGFSSATNFCKTYLKFIDVKEECFISNLIFDMILLGQLFYGLKTQNYKDWGTIQSWNRYKSQYKCLFVDIDGTLVTNSSMHFPPYIGSGEPIIDNIEYLNQLYKLGKVKIILTTSRPEKMRDVTIKEMEDKGIMYDQLVMNLPHCKRIIINDFEKSNPYPSCDSVNIPRNSNNLKDYLL